MLRLHAEEMNTCDCHGTVVIVECPPAGTKLKDAVAEIEFEGECRTWLVKSVETTFARPGDPIGLIVEPVVLH